MSVGVNIRALPRGITCLFATICSFVLTAPSFAQLPELSGGRVPTLAPLVRE